MCGGPDARAPQVASSVTCDVIRCRGVTKSGFQCKWTAASENPVAAPLRTGGHFCFWHASRRKAKLHAWEEDPRQQRIERFFSTDSSSASQDARSDDNQSSNLTPEQWQRIAQNRREALERRLRRAESESFLEQQAPTDAGLQTFQTQSHPAPAETSECLSQTQPLPSQALPDLSQAQLDCIEQKRLAALERRRQRQAESVVSAPTGVATPQASPSKSLGAVEVVPAAATQEDNARSRTPERRPRRKLMAMVTGSPPPLPAHLLSGSCFAAVKCM